MTAIKEEFATPRVCQITHDDRRDHRPRPGRRQGARHRHDRGAVRQGRRRPTASRPRAAAVVVSAAPSSRPTTSSATCIFTTAHAFLLFFSNRGRVYRLRAMDIPERERTAKGMPIVNLLPLQAGRDHPGDHRHPRLRRRAQPVLRHPPGRGQEDVVPRVRQRSARRADRAQPARRRRAGPGHRDQRHRRHLHGQPQGHDHPLQRGRGAGDGPCRRRACAA